VIFTRGTAFFLILRHFKGRFWPFQKQSEDNTLNSIRLESDKEKLAAQEAQRIAMANLRTQKINQTYENPSENFLKKYLVRDYALRDGRRF
jgi:hypothetical protein